MWLECVPNVSTSDQRVIQSILNDIEKVDSLHVLHVDSGISANRTVITFMVRSEHLRDACFAFFSSALNLIDMGRQIGVHPRMGAVDVFPIVPLTNTPSSFLPLVEDIGEELSEAFKLPLVFYEASARRPEYQNLARARRNLEFFRTKPYLFSDWVDLGKDYPILPTGITAFGIRKALVAINFDVDTKDLEKVKRMAQELRESGYIKSGNRIPGFFKGLKCIGWYLEDRGHCQLSCNVVDRRKLSLYEVFAKAQEIAAELKTEITGTELIGLMPRDVLLRGNPFSGNEPDKIRHGILELKLSNKPESLMKNRILEEVIHEKAGIQMDLKNWP